MGETAIALLFCNLLSGGQTEVRHVFPNVGEPRSVRVDCETPTHVIEIGLDGRPSSRDSVHQAIFAHLLTEKIPMVVVIDQDGIEDRYQYEMRVVTRALGIPYGVCKKHFIEAWVARRGFRVVPTGNDLPSAFFSELHCDLDGEFKLPNKEMTLSYIGLDKSINEDSNLQAVSSE